MPPRIPIYSAPQVQDQPLNAPTARPAPGSGLEGVGRGLTRFAGSVDDAVKDAYKKASVADVSKAKAEFEAEATRLYYDDVNGAFNQHGEKGVAASDAAYAALSKKKSEIFNRLGYNPLAQQLFDIDSTQALESYNRRGQSHQARERHVVAAANIDTLHKQAINSLPFAYNDPEERDRLIKLGDEAIKRLAPNKEAADAAIFEAHKDAHKTIVKAFLDNEDVEGAEQYFVQNAKGFGDDATQMRKVLLVAGRNKKADIASEQILNSTRGDNGWADHEKALSIVDNLDVEQGLKDEIRQRVQIRLNQNAIDRRKDIETVYDRVAGSYEAKGYGHWSKSDEAWLKQYSPDDWYKLRMRMRGDSEYWRRLKEGKEPESPDQVDAYAAARANLIRNPGRWASAEPSELRREFYHSLSPAGYKRLLEKDWPSHLQRMNSDLVNMPLIKRMVDTEVRKTRVNDEEVGGDGDIMREYVNEYIDDHITSKKTRMTLEDIQKALDYSKMKMIEEGHIQDGYRFTWYTNLKNQSDQTDEDNLLNPPEDQGQSTLENFVPEYDNADAQTQQIEKLLESGYTPEQILQIYNQGSEQ